MSSLYLRQLLWTINISLYRKLTLIVLFSRAIFVIMAAIIRAIIILSVCREMFVSVIITNLPVVQPLVQKCADRVGLSALFSRSTRAVHSYSLRSREVRGDSELRRKTRTDLHSVPQGAAWDSDEHILGMMDQVA
ncbi:Zinc finger BED domain-containing protein DAYSLEEPER [Fusarium oxysporum f. sp. albedinis]|nr:Zinc finger BED domain-containing protein DAYSLEEPER [Fusarium oxysporum f. sp. albedinis]